MFPLSKFIEPPDRVGFWITMQVATIPVGLNEYVARKTVTKNVRKNVTKNDTQHIAFLFSDPVWLRPEYPFFSPLFKNSQRAK